MSSVLLIFILFYSLLFPKLIAYPIKEKVSDHRLRYLKGPQWVKCFKDLVEIEYSNTLCFNGQVSEGNRWYIKI